MRKKLAIYSPVELADIKVTIHGVPVHGGDKVVINEDGKKAVKINGVVIK